MNEQTSGSGWSLLPVALLRGAGFPWHLIEECRATPEGDPGTLDKARHALYRTLQQTPMAEAVHLCSASMEARLCQFAPDRLPPRDGKMRKLERRLYGYLQRFCCKNDTTGVFGPIDYATLDPDQREALSVNWADSRITERRALLSYWAATAIAGRIACSALSEALCPALAPTMRIEGDGVLDLSRGEAVPLAAEIMALLALIDGETPLAALCAGLAPEQRALRLRIVDTLAELGVLRIGIELPPTCEDPLALLLAFCRGAPSGAERDRWLGELTLLAGLLRQFAHADLATRRALACEMGAHAARLGGAGDHRGAGEFYADRAVFHEEARGGVARMGLGRPVLERLRQELLPCLDAFAVRAGLVRDAWQEAVASALAAAFPAQDTLPFAQVAAFIARRENELEVRLDRVAEFDRALTDSFRAGRSGNEAVLAPEELARLAGRWQRPATCAFASPDILLEASDLDSLNRGEFRIVLGEVHGGAQVWSGLLRFQPAHEREALRAAIARRLGLPGMPLMADLIAGRRVGRNFLHELPCLVVEYTGRSAHRTELTVPVSDLEVRIAGRGLALWSRSRGRPVELCRGTLTGPLADTFALEVQSFPLRFGHYTPRLCVGPLVLQRETWVADAASVRAALSDRRFGPDPQQRMVHGLRKLGWPERIFIRSDAERKPVYLDAASPFAADMLFSLLRLARHITATEVLPHPQRLWFAPGGAAHTCEFRLSAFHVPA